MNAILTIACEVARIRGIALNDLLSERRTRDVVGPRHEAMYFARHLTPASLPVIGRRIGGRDHTTVLHAVRVIEARIEAEPGYGDELEAIQTAIRLKLPAPASLVLVPAADVDASASAERIMAAVGKGRRVEIYADEVVAIAAALTLSEKTVADLQARETQTRPPVLTLTAPEPLPMLRRPEVAPLHRAVRAVVAAFRQQQADQYTSRERFSQKTLDLALMALKHATEEKEILQ